MDTYLCIASRRDERRYSEAPVADDVLERVLDAGRLSGSAQNRQPWTFVVVDDRAALDRLAELVYAPANVRGCRVAVVVAVSGKGPTSFDAGRAAQNMLLAAWNEGLASCPNGMPDRDAVRELLGLGDTDPVIVLSFGYPTRPRNVEARTAGEWSARANRKPLAEVVRRTSGA